MNDKKKSCAAQQKASGLFFCCVCFGKAAGTGLAFDVHEDSSNNREGGRPQPVCFSRAAEGNYAEQQTARVPVDCAKHRSAFDTRGGSRWQSFVRLPLFSLSLPHELAPPARERGGWLDYLWPI